MPRVGKNGLKNRIGTVFELIRDIAYLLTCGPGSNAGLTVYSEVVLLLRLWIFLWRRSIGFFVECEHTASMDSSLTVRKRFRFLWRPALSTFACLLAALSLPADTHDPTGSGSMGACYCHCAMSRAHGGCSKMCETPKYASRWWATSCARPHRKAPVDNPGASPRLPHPDRAEHASL